LGVLGSVLVEVAALTKGVADCGGSWPDKYRKAPTVIMKIIFPFFAGAIPIIFEAANALTAVYLGASAPIIIDRLASGVQPSVETA
jgi:hypothetical protein